MDMSLRAGILLTLRHGNSKEVRRRKRLVTFNRNRPDWGQITAITMGTESRGRRYGSNGQLLRSPKGALGEMQVMPATARNPGYGIRPSNGTPDDLARVGREYLPAMYRYYGNDPAKMWAAYNGGPGNLDRALRKAKANGTDNWLQYMPSETRAYVQKNMKELGVW